MATECHCFVNCSHSVGHSCLKSGRLAPALSVPSTWAGTCFVLFHPCGQAYALSTVIIHVVTVRQTRKMGNSGNMKRGALHNPMEASYQKNSKNSSTVDNY